jgi:putative membrane protein
MATKTRKPETFKLDDPELIFAEPDATVADLLVEPPTASGEIVEAATVTAPPPKGSPLAKLFWSSLGGLIALGFGLGVTHLIEDLFARNLWLGYVGLGLAGIFAFVVLVLFIREFFALRRLGKIDGLRARAEEAIAQDDRTLARSVVADLESLYARNARTARGRTVLAREKHAIIDGSDLVGLAERELMANLDREAHRLVANAAKRVSVVTAVAPRAIIDVAVVAATAIALIRKIAEVYGGRPGTLGFFRLLRHVLTHLAVTGGMAAGEGLLDQLVGHGLAAKLSARLGEGVINGVLTARIGLAAIAVCRPLPFAARKAPTLREVAGGLFRQGEK